VISGAGLIAVADGTSGWAPQLLQRPRRILVAGVGGASVPGFGLLQVAALLEQEPKVELGVVVAGVGGASVPSLGLLQAPQVLKQDPEVVLGVVVAGGVGSYGGPGMPLQPLEASGPHNLRVGAQYWGQVGGVVTKQAARVRVLFDMGIPALDLVPVEVGDRFPVNFYAGFYQQSRKDERPCTWQVVRVVGFDETGRKVAER
jgi:hypothetical protein